MSRLVNDKEVTRKRKALKEPELKVPLRDQIPKLLRSKLEAQDVGPKLVEMWATGNADRQIWLDRQEEYLGDWDEFLESTSEGPFTHSSTLHVPMPLIVAKTTHARFLQALLGQDPPFNIKARKEAFVDRASLVQDVMRYALKEWANNNKGADEVLDAWLWDWVTTGVGILKIRWDIIWSSYVDVRQVPGADFIETTVDENGIETNTPKATFTEEEERVTKKVFEGPCFERVHPEDLLIIGGEGDPQEAELVVHQSMLTRSQMLSFADQGIFDPETVKEIIEGGPDPKHGGQTDNIKQQRHTNSGHSDLERDTELDKYRILECYAKLPIDGSGIDSDIIAWVHERSRKIVRATYSHRVSAGGKKPFFKIDFMKRPGQEYGFGLIEMLHPLSKELDAMHNMRIDFGILATMPFGFYRPTSSIDPETIQLEPGALIPVDDPARDVVFPNLGNRTSFGHQEEAALQQMVERLTGISDLNLGVLSGNQGATRTATGTRALVGELSANLDVFLRRLNLGWKSALEFLLHMLQQRIPKGLSFRITGETGNDYWRLVREEEEVQGDFDLELSANSQTSNPSIQQANADAALQLTSNPLDIQLGIITPSERYEALKNWYQSRGIKDFGRFVRVPPQNDRRFTPEEEANRLLAGIPVLVTPEMDHEGFIRFVDEFLSSDELLGQIDEEQTELLVRQQQQHAQMAQALQAAAAQQANAQQMQLNAQQSQQQTALGPEVPVAQGGGGDDGGSSTQ